MGKTAYRSKMTCFVSWALASYPSRVRWHTLVAEFFLPCTGQMRARVRVKRLCPIGLGVLPHKGKTTDRP